MGLIAVVCFVALFVALPLLQVVVQGIFDFQTWQFSLKYFGQFFDAYYARHLWTMLANTMVMGLGAATGGTILGFIFAYALVRCSMPFARVTHYVSLLPTISPPFAIAIAVILLFGRNGLITRQLLGIRFSPGMNDIYGLDGVIFVQIITFFPVAYLILRAMLERIDASMEEAALSLGASKFHIFRTVTLPLLAPGIAASFLLLFVESLADLGNPLLLGGNMTVLSTEIYMAVAGQYDQQKGAALSVILLVPTLTLFILQRYYIGRRSYVSVTGKPTTGRVFVKEPVTRWTFIILTLLALALVLLLYFTILAGSLTKAWGVDNTFYLGNYVTALTRGLNPILSTTYLSAVATPVAGLIGMVIAFMVVRRVFAGKQTLDFVSNLGGAVPGTILGIGYIIVFIQAPWVAVVAVYALLAAYLIGRATARRWLQLVLLVGTAFVGYYLNWAPYLLGLTEDGWRYVLMIGFLLLAVVAGAFAEKGQRKVVTTLLLLMALAMLAYNLSPTVTEPLGRWGRQLPGVNWPKVVARLVSFIEVFTRPNLAILGFTFLAMGIFAVERVRPPGAHCGGCRDRHAERIADLLRPVAGARGHALYHHRRLRRAQPARLGARRRGLAAADRPVYRRGVHDPGCGRPAHLPPRHAATDSAGLLCRPGLRLCAAHDEPLRRHLSDDGAVADPDGVDSQRGGAGRHERRRGLFGDPDRDRPRRHRADGCLAPAHLWAHAGRRPHRGRIARVPGTQPHQQILSQPRRHR